MKRIHIIALIAYAGFTSTQYVSAAADFDASQSGLDAALHEAIKPFHGWVDVDDSSLSQYITGSERKRTQVHYDVFVDYEKIRTLILNGADVLAKNEENKTVIAVLEEGCKGQNAVIYRRALEIVGEARKEEASAY